MERGKAEAWLVGLILLLAGTANSGTRLYAENDLGYSDRHYTHGTRIEQNLDSIRTPEWVGDMDPSWPEGGGGKTVLVLAQHLYSPSDISLPDPPEDDHPYGAVLWGGARFCDAGASRLDSLEILAGMVGPSALGEETQSLVHEWVDSRQPQGWDHQIKDEPVVQLKRERTWSACRIDGDVDFDVLPSACLALGNAFTYPEAGVMSRLGWNLPKDYGQVFMSPREAQGVGDKFALYASTGAKSRMVLRNIFLDGNTFRDSRSVDKETWVSDLFFGIHLRIWSFEVSLYQTLRTREFEEQDHANVFRSANLSYAF